MIYYYRTLSQTEFFRTALEAGSVEECRTLCRQYREREYLQYNVISNHRVSEVSGELEYLTVWSYYPYADWTWEPAENIEGCTLQLYKSWKGLN
jgi:hypothetical protein